MGMGHGPFCRLARGLLVAFVEAMTFVWSTSALTTLVLEGFKLKASKQMERSFTIPESESASS